MSIPPVLTIEQRDQALVLAKKSRTRQAEIRRSLLANTLTISEVIIIGKQDPAVAKMRILDLVLTLPGIGKKKARQILEDCSICQTRRIRGLGWKQQIRLNMLLKNI